MRIAGQVDGIDPRLRQVALAGVLDGPGDRKGIVRGHVQRRGRQRNQGQIGIRQTRRLPFVSPDVDVGRIPRAQVLQANVVETRPAEDVGRRSTNRTASVDGWGKRSEFKVASRSVKEQRFGEEVLPGRMLDIRTRCGVLIPSKITAIGIPQQTASDRHLRRVIPSVCLAMVKAIRIVGDDRVVDVDFRSAKVNPARCPRCVPVATNRNREHLSR